MNKHVMAVVLAVCLSLVGVGRSQAPRVQADVRNGVLTIDVDQEFGALHLAIDELSRLCQCSISFEEPEWAFPGDLEEFESKSGQRVRTLKRTSIRLSRTVTTPLTRAETASLLNELIAIETAEGHSARFEVVEGRGFQVRPLSVKGADGVELAVRSLLDVPISLQRDTASPDVWLHRVAAAVRLSAKRSVLGVYPPNAPLTSRQVTLEANSEPARDVLERLLEALPRQGSWALSYIPAFDRFFIALRYGPGPAQ